MWIKLTKAPTHDPVAINMANIWKMEPTPGGQTELHSLGANSGGHVASLTVTQTIDEILAML